MANTKVFGVLTDLWEKLTLDAGHNERGFDIVGDIVADGNLLKQIEGGAYFGRNKITENQWYIENVGVTWVARDSARGWLGVSMSSDGKYQTAVVSGGQIYTSADYGVTWIARESARNWLGVSMSSDGKYQTAAVGGGQIYTSADYGVTWIARESARSWRRVSLSSDGKYQTAAVGGGQIYTSADYGVTWVARESARNWLGVSMSSDGKYQTAVVDGGQIYTSADYGVTWIARDSARNWQEVSLSSDGKYQTAVAYGGQIYTSADYGVTWIARDSARGWLGVSMSSDGKYQTAAVGGGQIYTSADYGVTWIARESARNWLGVSMSSDGKYQTAVVDGGQIYTSWAESSVNGELNTYIPDGGVGHTIKIDAVQASITALDTFVDFRSNTGSEGSIAGTASAGVIAYNTFTGSHYTLIEDKVGLEAGMLLSSTGVPILDFPEMKKIEKVNQKTLDKDGNVIKEEIVDVVLKTYKASPKGHLVKSAVTNKKQDKAAWGVYGGTDKEGRDMVFALGTGYMLVTNTGGNISIGDYLQSSNIKGMAEKQADDVLHNYTVGKSLVNVVFGAETKKLIPVTYHGG